MAVPQNAQAIYTYLTGKGFSANAAAGILGNIEQESGGNPTAGSDPPGAGLIQILGDPGGSLSSELDKTMAYILANGSVAAINAHASSPAAAALYFSTTYERPNPADANNANRQQSAQDVAAAASSGNWSTAASSTSGSGSNGSSATLDSITGSVSGIVTDFDDIAKVFVNLTQPSFWLRIGMFIVGTGLLVIAVFMLAKAPGGGGGKIPVPVPV
jgi:hypothetical protein